MHQQPIFEEWNVQYHLGYLAWGSKILQYTIPGGHCTRKIMPLNNPPAQFSGVRNPLYQLLIWLVKKRHDNTKGRHKGLLKDTKNHSSVYDGPSLIHYIRIAQKGDPKGYSRTPRVTLQCTMAQVYYIAYGLLQHNKVRTFMYLTKSLFLVRS